MLLINNLSVSANNKAFLSNLNLEIKDGEIHAIMGPNGAGKSTLCKVILNDPDYQIDNGNIFYNYEDITGMDTSLISKSGIYIVNQSPIAIEGITNAELLRVALEEKLGKKVNIFEFNKKLESLCKDLDISKEFIFRDVNLGMSGGERKKNELLHMWMLEPSFIILDEIDSGLDVDALKLVSDNLHKYIEIYHPSILMVTHHEGLIKSLKPDFVHILKNGKNYLDGDFNLAIEVLKNGFKNMTDDDAGNNYEE